MKYKSTFHLKSIIFLCVYILCIGNVFSQNNCGTDLAHEHRLANDPQYAEEINVLEAKILESIQNGSEERVETIVIPVVVHVLHRGENVGTSVNITDAQIISAINGASNRWNDDNGPGVNMNIEFCLAQTDPNGNPTNGITRTNASGVTNYLTNGMILSYEGNSNELALKNLGNWPHNQYYNIWIVHQFNAGWGGYAYFPTLSNYAIDGATLQYNSMTSGSSLLSHEIGHGMNLYHTFDGASGNNCPANTNCQNQGDRVCDTPPHLQNECSTTNCGTGILNNSFDNYMSYCGGLDLFTTGQKARVDAAFISTSRADLLNSTVCSPPCQNTNTTIQGTTCDADLAGTTTTTYTNQGGCDSVVTLVITLLPSNEIIIHISTCDTIDWGIVIDTFTNQYGCDSIITTIYNFIPSPIANFTYSVDILDVEFANTSLYADTFEWDFGDGTTGSQNPVVHSYTQSGQYFVRLVATNGCGADTIYQTVDLVINAMNTISIIDEINLVPNPNQGAFVVELKGRAINKSISLTLYDAEGKLVDSRYSNYSGWLLESYELNKIASGNYFLQINVEGEVSRTIQFEVVNK